MTATPNGECSLREAISAANTNLAVDGCPAGGAGDIVVIPSGFFIRLTHAGADALGLVGDLDITGPLTIRGAGPLTSVVNGNQTDRVFEVAAGTPVQITGLRIENGRVTDANGGGIWNKGTLRLSNSLVTGNSSNYSTTNTYGGGIRNDGTLTVSGSWITNNSAAGSSSSGGGVAQEGTPSAVLKIQNSVVSGNTASAAGGGVLSDEGSAEILSSTIANNRAVAGGGGGLGLYGNATSVFKLADLTISDNSAAQGGGVALTTSNGASLTRLTLLRNSVAAPSNGGGLLITQSGDELVDVVGTNISKNTSGGSGGGLSIVGIGSGGVSVRKTTVSENKATNGDGISNAYTGGELQLSNSTITANRNGAGQGGGIWNATSSTGSLQNVTLSENGADSSSGGGNIYNLGSLTVGNTIIYNDFGGLNCSGTGTITYFGHNLSDDTNCGATDVTGNPLLQPLQGNGGPTPTQALGSGSAALNRGSNCAASDQRGAPRSRCDLGAYERIMCAGGLVNRVGTAGRDRMTGTAAAEVFLMLGGNDVLNPGGGADRACMGSGSDTVSARDGKRDILHGEGGSGDRLATRDSNDSFTGFERFG